MHPGIFGQVSGASLAGLGHALPRRSVTTRELVADEERHAWVLDAVGTESRRICGPDETSLSLATRASKLALQDAGLTAHDIDGIVVATSSPDMRAPSTACLLQAELSVQPGAPAFDLQAVCSGFIFALSVATSLISTTGADAMLVVGVDTFSRVTDWSRRDNIFFGDAAGAVVLRRTKNLDRKISFLLNSAGEAKPSFSIPTSQTFFEMNAQNVYNHATQVLPLAIRRLLRLSGVDMGQITKIVPHQASRRVLEKLAADLGVPEELVEQGMRYTGNTAAASIPLLLSSGTGREAIARNNPVVLAAVGSGWTWGACLIE